MIEPSSVVVDVSTLVPSVPASLFVVTLVTVAYIDVVAVVVVSSIVDVDVVHVVSSVIDVTSTVSINAQIIEILSIFSCVILLLEIKLTGIDDGICC